MSTKGIIGSSIVFLMMMLLACSPSLAEKKGGVPETKYSLLKCPKCKEKRLGAVKGRTLAKTVMVCEDCKTEMKEHEVHSCTTCGEDVEVCVVCARMTVGPLCPNCKTQRLAAKKGREPAKNIIVCTDCEKEIKEFDVYECPECKQEFRACPKCKKLYQQRE